MEGTGEVRDFSGETHAIRVRRDPDRMAHHGLAPSDVIEAIQRRTAPRAADSVGSAPASPDQALPLGVSAREHQGCLRGMPRTSARPR